MKLCSLKLESCLSRQVKRLAKVLPALCLGLLCLEQIPAEDSSALYTLQIQKGDPKVSRMEGAVLLKAADGGILFQKRDGSYLNVVPENIVELIRTGQKFEPFPKDHLEKILVDEMGEGFFTISTDHYVIVTDADRKYAYWSSVLLERLLKVQLQYWSNEEKALQPPEFPLIAVIFSDRNRFVEYAHQDVGQAMEGAYGYYSVKSNRIVMYDLTEGARLGPAKSMSEISRRIHSNPSSIATVIHEATHQIAFNIGLQTRYADTPLWLSEGLALYAESPDPKSRSGWKSVGQMNHARLARFRKYFRKRKEDSLRTLIETDQRMTSPEEAEEAYAEAWAFTYFLVKTRKEKFLKYLNLVSRKPRLIYDSPEKRLEDLETVFEMKWEELDRQFITYMRKISRKYR